MRTLAGFTPDLEIYSIDEAFLGLAGFELRLESHARDLRRTVLQWTGIPVSVGIASTKTLAKVANRRAKKDPACGGVCVLRDETAIDAQLSSMALDDLWGVGCRIASKLAMLGITNPLQLKRADPQFIRERFSVVLARTVAELRGVPCIELEEAPPDRKSIMASRSFGKAVEHRREMEEAVASYTTRAAEKLRRQSLAASRLVVFVTTNRFRPQDPQYAREQAVTLSVATNDTAKLIGAAERGLAAIWKPGYRYKKAGVLLLDLAPAASVQGGLFDKPDDDRSKSRMRAMDALNARYGRDTVTFAAAGTQRAWKLRSAFVSPRFSTNWEELLAV
jgi:DNA polymerase V